MSLGTRRLYRRLLAEGVVPQPFDIDEFRRRADAWRGRASTLIHQPADFWTDDVGCAGVYAVTVSAGDTDLIIIRSDGTPEWRAQCIGHEYGHLLLGHNPRGAITTAQVRRLFGDDLFTDPEYIRDLLTGYTRADLSIPIEREAELFAELLAFTPDSPTDPLDHTRMRYGFTTSMRRRP